MTLIQNELAQNLLLPINAPKNQGTWVTDMVQTIQPVLTAQPYEWLTGGTSVNQSIGNFAAGIFNPIFPLTALTRPVRIIGLSLQSLGALGAGVTIRGALMLERGASEPSYHQLSDVQTFTAGDFALFASCLLANDLVLLRPGQDAIGYFGQSLVGAAPSMVFETEYIQY